MGDLAYYDGVISRYEDTKIDLSDRSIFFGDGVYDVMLARCGRIHQAGRHIDRLFGNAEAIGLGRCMSKDELHSVILELCAEAGYYESVVYVQLSRRAKRRDHGCREQMSPSVLVTVTEYTGYEARPMRLITLPDVRHGMCHVKAINLLPSVLAIREAESRGCDGAIFLRDGVVTEGARSNVSILKDGRLYTHPRDNLILPGVMRENLIRAARALGIEVCECEFGRDELISADEILVSSTTKFIRRTAQVDGTCIKMGDGERFSSLLSEILSDYLSLCC